MQHNFLEQADRCTENIKMYLSKFLNYAIKYVGLVPKNSYTKYNIAIQRQHTCP